MEKDTLKWIALLVLIAVLGTLFAAALYFTDAPQEWEAVKDFFSAAPRIHSTAVLEALIFEPQSQLQLQDDGRYPVGSFGAEYEPSTGTYYYPESPCIRQTIIVDNDSMQFSDGTVLSGCIRESNVFLTPTP